MVTYLSSLASQLLICLAGLTLCVLTQLQAQAADGDILILREVQPRAAARKELMPDPNPRVVNPDHSEQIRSNIRSGGTLMEVSDRDFANVTSGTSLGRGVQVFNQPGEYGMDNLRGAGGLGISTGGGGARAGGGTARIGSDVTRSVQQGLRPLQNMGK